MPLFELPPLSPCSKLCPRTPSLRPPFSTTQKTKTKSTKWKQEKKNFRILSESKKRIHKPPILPCIEKGQSQKEGRFFFCLFGGFLEKFNRLASVKNWNQCSKLLDCPCSLSQWQTDFVCWEIWAHLEKESSGWETETMSFLLWCLGAQQNVGPPRGGFS